MVNAQEWLDKKYPLETRNNIKQIKASPFFGKLKGKLNVEGFNGLEKLDCSKNKIDNLVISNCPQLKKINCNDNQLTKLSIANCSNLIKVYCQNNYLNNLNLLTNLNPEKLERLYLNSNNFRGQYLSSFSRFGNLERLCVGNWKYEFDVYNRFEGSLEPLENLNKLKRLDIAGTDITSGLEYLPNSIKYINCSFGGRIESEVGETILKELWNVKNPGQIFPRRRDTYSQALQKQSGLMILYSANQHLKLYRDFNNLKKWKRNNHHLVELAQARKNEQSSTNEIFNEDYEREQQAHEVIVEVPPKK